MTVSIVIPNYNTWDLVKRNIDACLFFDKDQILEIIVVDDHSPIENYYEFESRVRIIRNPENYRYTKAVNQGLKAAVGDIVILLDSDAYPTHSFINELKYSYGKDKHLGSVGFKTINEEGKDSGNTMAEPSILSLISGQKLHGLLRRYNFLESKHILPFSCAVSYRKDCLDDIGYLDETFQVLDADHDLSMRIHRSSWKLIYNDKIEIYHVGGGSIPKDGKRVMMFYQSRLLLLKKFNKLSFPLVSLSLIILRLQLEKLVIQIREGQNSAKAQSRVNLIKLVRNEL